MTEARRNRRGLLAGESAPMMDLGIAGEAEGGGASVSLADRFLVPPFSVLDARQGYWQQRKRAWLGLGIKSELGRGENIVPNGTIQDASQDGVYRRTGPNGLLGFSEQARSHYKNAAPGGSPRPATRLGPDGKTRRGDGVGREMVTGPATSFTDQARLTALQKTGDSRVKPRGAHTYSDMLTIKRQGGTVGFDGSKLYREPGAVIEPEEATAQSGTSIFDPVLCELAYRWFSPAGGAVLDPFAGGSVRGIVAARCGRRYTGVDLSERQIAANIAQRDLCGATAPVPDWRVGDSREIVTIAPGAYDMLFTCPPYADLEVYSDHPADISTLGYADFLVAYKAIIKAAVGLLEQDRFAVWVVGDIRDKRGHYRGFVLDTILAFEEVGLPLYNEAILVTAAGSLPLRAGGHFASARKLGKSHQNVLVFVKGDWKRAAELCGLVEVFGA